LEDDGNNVLILFYWSQDRLFISGSQILNSGGCLESQAQKKAPADARAFEEFGLLKNLADR
jgi:hypothetical protein